jgi:hypothetical protein
VSRVINQFYSSFLLIVNTLACHAVEDLTPSLSKELLGDNHREALKKLTFLLSKASTDAYSFYRFHFNIYFIFMIVHLRIGDGWRLVALWFSLKKIPCLPL